MNTKSPLNINSVKSELRWLFFISLGVFLFILFFQPFPLETLDYNSRLLYVFGFWGITFILSVLVLIFLPLLFKKWLQPSTWEDNSPIILYVLLLAVTAISFVFYVRFVGKTPLTLYVLFKIILVCLIPIFILMEVYKNKNLESIIVHLKRQNKLYAEKITTIERSDGENKVVIFSGNKAEKLSLKIRDIILIKSADNYVDIHYVEEGIHKNKLIRNTLKDIDYQMDLQKYMVRCHRTCIVNTMFIDKLSRDYKGYTLKLKYLDGNISVSKQYLSIIKEAILEQEKY